MSPHLTFEAMLTFLVGFFFVLFLTGCAKPAPDYWGSLARGVQEQGRR